ncbi:hypothetical protein [Parvibaculum sp.]|jgi:hypothetical protein|uniref:hypothetical protein n=1 Tax=Parvibaculum sp. TaxID=2024848 RepID=UPI003BA9E46A
MKQILSVTFAVLIAAPAFARGPTSPELPQLQTIPNPVAKPEPRKSFIPGHKSEYGGWVRPQMREGAPIPPVAPSQESKGYIPGHYDKDGNWVPGQPH